MVKNMTLAQAIELARDHYKKACQSRYLGTWVVEYAAEDVEQGVYVIRAEVRCLLETESRRHEIWVSVDIGEIVHERRIVSVR